MRNIESSSRTAVLALVLGCTAGSALAADAFPSRPIRMIVPFSAGGASDGPARIFAAEIKVFFGLTLAAEPGPLIPKISALWNEGYGARISAL